MNTTTELKRRLSERRSSSSSGAVPKTFNAKDRTVDAALSKGSPVQRIFGIEKLRISASAVDLSRMESSGIPILDSHQQSGITNSIGRLVRVWFEGSTMHGRIKFHQTEKGERAFGMVKRGEISGISVGYAVDKWQITDAKGRVLDPDQDHIDFSSGDLTFEAIKWRLFEASLVSVPADDQAMIRSLDGGNKADARARMQARTRMQARARMIRRAWSHPADEPAPDQHHKSNTRAEPKAEREVTKVENNMNYYDTRILRDENEGRAEAMEHALAFRILNSHASSDHSLHATKLRMHARQHHALARDFAGRSIVEMAAQCIGYRARGFLNVGDAARILERAFNTTSDFPSIFQNALNKALLARYQLHTPTYREIAAKREFKDFRPHPQVRAGDFPQLQPVLQSGELAYGSTTDNNEPISVSPYGVIFTIARTMLVNDDLGAIDQILSSAGDMVLVFENVTFYNMFNSNPVLNQDGTAVFATAHGNLDAVGAVPSVTSIAAGRAALRSMKSISGNFINVPPSIILTGPAQETAADQLVASITPTLTTSVNPFSSRLRSVSDANITDKSWYLMTEPARVPSFVYGFLAGSGGPRTRTFEPFGVQGLKVSLEHDFGCGAIDFRGAYKNVGA